jgi:hypothetical protein
VTVLGPGAADLEAIGANLMDVRRRRYVLETALATTSSALREPESLDALVHRLESDVTRHDEESEAR